MEGRKQNTACDACRARKVKCNRVPGSDRCVHCATKNLECTHFQQQATQHKKRAPRSGDAPSSSTPSYSGPPRPRAASAINTSSATPAAPLSAQLGLSINPTSSLHAVLAHLLAPPPEGYPSWGPTAVSLASPAARAELAADLAEVYLQIVHPRLPLLNPARLRAQIRAQPFVSSTNPRDRGRDPERTTPLPIHPALLAVVLAWGAKFAEHPLLLADRALPAHNGASFLASALIARTRALAEALAVHRIPSPDHILCALLLEPLQSQDPRDPDAFHGFWLRAAVGHLMGLRVNYKSTLLAIQDGDARGTMVFAWWMACLADAYGSAYYRRKPMLDDDDYDVDFYTAQTAGVGPSGPNAAGSASASGSTGQTAGADTNPSSNPTSPTDPTSPDTSPRDQLEVLGYYRAAHALARVARTMSRRLWTPAVEAGGIPHATLRLLTQALAGWRAAHLAAVGVPRDFGRGWGFVEAVSTCASDATFHVMWVILFGALDEFGVKEFASLPDPAAAAEKDEVCATIAEQALHGALRIAGLAAVLTQNGYLRLDPAVMHVSCIHAGGLLARLGRPEVQACILGLEQYAHAYSEAGAQAAALRAVYEGVVGGGGEGGGGQGSGVGQGGGGQTSEAMQTDDAYGYDTGYGYGYQQESAYGNGNGNGHGYQGYSEGYQAYGSERATQGFDYSHARSTSPNGNNAAPGPSGYGQTSPTSTMQANTSSTMHEPSAMPASATYQQTSYARSSSAPANNSTTFAEQQQQGYGGYSASSGATSAYPSSLTAGYPSTATGAYPTSSTSGHTSSSTRTVPSNAAFPGSASAFPASSSTAAPAFPGANTSNAATANLNNSTASTTPASKTVDVSASAPTTPLEATLAAQGFPLHPHARGFPTGAKGLRFMRGAARELMARGVGGGEGREDRERASKGDGNGDGMDVEEGG
ncbi:hypothetical protein K523DRAFT_421785 [Schizophyllum commune Tattone D]|nr:hypothetical protein K523DRAFT_421785 [Schizophyllum commune Tattone D]